VKKRHHSGGFAYLWTLLLVALMGSALAIGGELYATSVRRDKEAQLLFVGHEFRQALGRYLQAKGGALAQYPLTLDELLQDPRTRSRARRNGGWCCSRGASSASTHCLNSVPSSRPTS
jgi:type II secretory pathway pseudopilin PulG